jgi:hypothetical protein
MGYKLLGFAVWRAGKWYLSRRIAGSRRKLALTALAGATVAGVAAGTRARSSR